MPCHVHHTHRSARTPCAASLQLCHSDSDSRENHRRRSPSKVGTKPICILAFLALFYSRMKVLPTCQEQSGSLFTCEVTWWLTYKQRRKRGSTLKSTLDRCTLLLATANHTAHAQLYRIATTWRNHGWRATQLLLLHAIIQAHVDKRLERRRQGITSLGGAVHQRRAAHRHRRAEGIRRRYSCASRCKRRGLRQWTAEGVRHWGRDTRRG